MSLSLHMLSLRRCLRLLPVTRRCLLTRNKPATSSIPNSRLMQTRSESPTPAVETETENTLEFVEEPLGVPAEMGYGYLQVDFHEKIGPRHRYEVLRKLGWGKYSSVWLARDSEEQRYVAIKALSGNGTGLNKTGHMVELPVMQRITDRMGSSRPPKNCLTLQDQFIVPGQDETDGEHLCLVLDVLAGDLEGFYPKTSPTSLSTDPPPKKTWAERALPPPLAKRALRDALRGLAQLHAAGIVHTDIKASNILCRCPSATSYDAISAILSEEPSRRNPPEQSFTGPIESAVSQPIPSPPLTEAVKNTTSFVLSDFGNAQMDDNHITSVISNETLRAPEIVLAGPWNFKVDIWSFGCLVFEFMVGYPLFLHDNPAIDQQTHHIAHILKFTGESFSPNLIQSYGNAPYILNMETGYYKVLNKPMPVIPISLLLGTHGKTAGISEHDIAGAVDLVTRCLRLDPADRPTADELLESCEWLKEVD